MSNVTKITTWDGKYLTVNPDEAAGYEGRLVYISISYAEDGLPDMDLTLTIDQARSLIDGLVWIVTDAKDAKP